MIELSASATGRVAAPPLVPADPLIDTVHLARMTLGDRSLEREVLGLFNRQAEILLARMRKAPPQTAAAFAHTLKGSARGIGAWQVAAAAEAVEIAADTAQRRELAAAIDRLAETIAAAAAEIAGLLAAR